MKKNRAALPTFIQSLWMWILSAPAAVKLVGLALLPVATIIFFTWLYVEFYIFRLLRASPDIALDAQILFDLSLQAFLWLGLGVLIGIGASVTLTWVLIRQLSGLVKTMGRVEAGERAVRSPVWSQDEIGQVQAAFNTMVNSLQQSRDDLIKNQRELESLDAENKRLIGELRETETELRLALRRAVKITCFAVLRCKILHMRYTYGRNNLGFTI